MINIETIQTIFKAPSKQVAASLFFKRYPVLTQALTTLVKTNQQNPTALNQYKIEVEPKAIKVTLLADPVAFENSEANRVRFIEQLVEENIKPLVDQMRLYIKEDILIAHLLHSMYQVYYEDETLNEAEKECFLQLVELVREQFVACQYTVANDYKIHLITHPLTQKPYLLRNVCCLAYEIKGKKCRVCPMLSEEERMKLLMTPKK